MTVQVYFLLLPMRNTLTMSVPWGGFLGIEEICDKVNMTLPVYTISW